MIKIQVKSLSFIYGKGTPFENKALENVNVSINKGDFVGVIGHTGSGKSTFVQQLNGLLCPTKGHILLDGEDIWKSPKKIRKVRFKVGLVFQYPEHQLFEETVYKDIAFGPSNMGLSNDEIHSRVKASALFVGLSKDILEKSPFEISGGEKRRVAIAGVMAMDPEVLILDEPTAGLDPGGRKMLLSQIKNYHKYKGNTVILVSHSMEDIAKVSDRVLVLSKGKVVMFDSTRKIFEKADQLGKMGLRAPEITKIMILLKKRGYNVNTGILTVDEGVLEIKRLLEEKENKSVR